MRVRYTPRALAQLDRILSYVGERNPVAAKKVAAQLKAGVERAALFPWSSRAVKKTTVRVLPVLKYPYLIFYEVDEAEQEIVIVSIRHQARNPAKHLRKS